MIEKNQNILKDSQIKRIIEYSEDNKQINILDSRFYRRNNKFYPSVSSILNFFPKNKYFETFLKDVGYNADIIAAKAAFEGSQVHNAIEKLIKGEQIEWIDPQGNALYTLEVWKMILKFVDFWKTYHPTLIAVEYHLFSDEHEYAGTADLICKINNKLWLIDIKTSNSLHTSHELQLAAYAMAWNETHSEPIEQTGIMWLKAATRKPDKKGEKMQGEGWQMKTFDRSIIESFKLFQNIHELYRLENPNSRPVTESLPISVKL